MTMLNWIFICFVLCVPAPSSSLTGFIFFGFFCVLLTQFFCQYFFRFFFVCCVLDAGLRLNFFFRSLPWSFLFDLLFIAGLICGLPLRPGKLFKCAGHLCAIFVLHIWQMCQGFSVRVSLSRDWNRQSGKSRSTEREWQDRWLPAEQHVVYVIYACISCILISSIRANSSFPKFSLSLSFFAMPCGCFTFSVIYLFFDSFNWIGKVVVEQEGNDDRDRKQNPN